MATLYQVSSNRNSTLTIASRFVPTYWLVDQSTSRQHCVFVPSLSPALLGLCHRVGLWTVTRLFSAHLAPSFPQRSSLSRLLASVSSLQPPSQYLHRRSLLVGTDTARGCLQVTAPGKTRQPHGRASRAVRPSAPVTTADWRLPRLPLLAAQQVGCAPGPGPVLLSPQGG